MYDIGIKDDIPTNYLPLRVCRQYIRKSQERIATEIAGSAVFEDTEPIKFFPKAANILYVQLKHGVS